MKKIFFVLLFIMPLVSFAQVIGYHENFELPSLDDSVSSSGTPTPWAISTALFHSGLRSDSSKVTASDTSYLTTSPFSTVGNSFVILRFSHICKIELLDAGEIEVSANGGPWVKLTGIQYHDPGNSQFVNNGNKFNSNTYPLNWAPTNNSAVPNNTWWKDEEFDISALAGNSPNVRIRFALRDGNGNGANANYGWLIDDISVLMSFSELDPPTITYINPLYLNTVYNLGPYNIKAVLSDVSGISEGMLFYKVNSGALDSVLMTVVSGDTMNGLVPAVNDQDTVSYFIRATDASPALNVKLNPLTGFRSFVATTGIHFPYVDDFDGASVLFYDTTFTAGTQWELGTPAYGSCNTAHSDPNAWDINLLNTYMPNANCHLYSPVFDFSATENATLSFWVNYGLESCCDGVTMEYTTDGSTWQVLGSVGDPNAVNWFNYTSVSSSLGKPVWTGYSGGWVKCEYLLSQLNNIVGPVQFRYIFTSDVSGQYDGFSVDDFSIIPPFEQDAGLESVVVPDLQGCVPAGTNPLKVAVANYGSDTLQVPFNITYRLDSLPPVSESFVLPLAAGEIDTFSFVSGLSLTPGLHNLIIYSEYPTDQFNLNDTLSFSFNAFAPLPLPYFNPLDSVAALNDFCIETGAYGRAFFDPAAANTGTGGVIFDASSSSGYMVYTDTLTGSVYYVWEPSVNPDQKASMRLIVNTDTITHLVMKFDLKMLYLWDPEYTNFRVTVDGIMVTPHLQPAGFTTPYETYEYDLSAFLPASALVIEFWGEYYESYDYTTPNGSGCFLDNIMIYQPPAQEAAMLQIAEPLSACGLGIEAVKVLVKNTGSDTITDLYVNYQVNGSSPAGPELIPDTLIPGDSAWHTFAALVDLSVLNTDSVFNFLAWTELAGDPFDFNDTLGKEVISMFIPPDPLVDSVYIVPYATDTVLHAVSPANIYWFDDPVSGNYILQGPDFQTPVVFDTISYYVEARNGSSGTDFFVGTGTLNNSTSGYPCPYGQYYNGARQQFLILASELSAAGIGPGPVTALAFDVVTPAGAALSNLSISIGQTSQVNLSSWITTGLTTVYSQPSFATITGWNEHVFSIPYTWDGVSNLLVETCFDNYPNGWTSNAVLNQTSTAFTSSLDFHSDGGSVCVAGAPSYTTPFMQRPNMRLKATSSGCPSNRIEVQVQPSGVPAFDAGVIAIDQPNTAVNLGMESVEIRVRNYGTSEISHFPIAYQVNALAPVYDSIHDTIQPGDTLVFVFLTQANLNTYNIYDLKAWTELSGDAYQVNDTAFKTVENQMPVYCPSSASSTADDDITCVSFGGISNASPTPYNGTYSDYTTLSPAYVFLDGDYPITVCIGFSGTYGYSGYCEAYIDFNADGVFTEPDEVVFGSAYASTPLSQTFNGMVHIPSSAVSGMTRMRLVAVEGGSAASVTPCGTYTWGETEDYRIFIFPILQNDAALLSFVSPQASESVGSQIDLEVQLKNNGIDTLVAVDIHWSHDGGTLQTYNWSGTLLPDSTTDVLLGNFTVNTGSNDLLAYTTLAGDSNTFNDTIRTYCFGLPPITYWLDDFEVTTSNWTTNQNSLWQHGVPASTVINSSHSPTRCWKTRLVGNYLNNREDYLYSPSINLSGINNAVLRFFQWWEAEPMDGGNLQYSINNGTTYITLGYQNDPNSVNWYNTFTNGKFFWNGEYGGWREAIYDLTQFNNQANFKFRFYFYTNASVNTYNGWAVDDIEIRVPRLPYDAGVVDIEEPAPVIPGGLVHPQVTIHNYGTDTLLTVPVAFVISGGGLIIENWTGSLPPDSSAEFSFTNTFIAPGGTFTFCSFTGMPADAYRFNDSLCLQVTNAIGVEEYLVKGFALGQNIPNPAGMSTEIPFAIPMEGNVQLVVTTLQGQEILRRYAAYPAGTHTWTLDTDHLSPGVYFYTMEFRGQTITQKMLIE